MPQFLRLRSENCWCGRLTSVLAELGQTVFLKMIKAWRPSRQSPKEKSRPRELRGGPHRTCVIGSQSCPTLCDPLDCSPPGSSVHGISQARILEWGAISFSRGPSRPRDQTRVSHIAGRRFTVWATREAHFVLRPYQNSLDMVLLQSLIVHNLWFHLNT